MTRARDNSGPASRIIFQAFRHSRSSRVASIRRIAAENRCTRSALSSSISSIRLLRPHRVGLLRVDLQLLNGLLNDGRLDRPAARELTESRQGDALGVHLEVPP